MPHRSIAARYAMQVAALLAIALAASGAVEIWASHRDRLAALEALQREKARAAAVVVSRFSNDVLRNLEWATLAAPQAAVDELEPRRLDLLKLLRLEPAVTTVSLIDPRGREQLRVSRTKLEGLASGNDLSRVDGFTQAHAGSTHFGELQFLAQSEPYLTIFAPSAAHDGSVVMADLDLRFVQTVVSRVEVGRTGYAYVVDSGGRLVSHRELSVVLQMRDLSRLPQVVAASHPGAGAEGFVVDGLDLDGGRVLSAYARIAPLGWTVFVEQPRDEAFAPLIASIERSALILLVALALAIAVGIVSARRLVAPIRSLRSGAQRFGAGDLAYRIEVASGDELEELATQFNAMAIQLRESYADLERRVAERTHELSLANQAKSRFLAAASHDLRQPMHALALFVDQLRASRTPAERVELMRRIEDAVSSLAELLDQLLDLSKLEAGAVQAVRQNFNLREVLASLEAQLTPLAQAKGIGLRLHERDAWLQGDPVLVQRVLLNLIVNAIRYTERGGVFVGCRRRGAHWRVEVWDTGCGIPAERSEDIFREFVRLGGAALPGAGGLGLGLAIVGRLARLLGTHIELRSRVGRGSVFAFELPLGTPGKARLSQSQELLRAADLRGVFVVVIDDSEDSRVAMCGLLERWGCLTISAADASAVVEELASHDRPPELIISDYHLAKGEDGLAAIARIRAATDQRIPAILVTAETGSALARAADSSGVPVLHKPVSPVKLRALLARLLAADDSERAG